MAGISGTSPLVQVAIPLHSTFDTNRMYYVLINTVCIPFFVSYPPAKHRRGTRTHATRTCNAEKIRKMGYIYLTSYMSTYGLLSNLTVLFAKSYSYSGVGWRLVQVLLHAGTYLDRGKEAIPPDFRLPPPMAYDSHEPL